ncbi:MAG TPA: hypothetical protein V6C76_02550 [Drouetiella sp.]
MPAYFGLTLALLLTLAQASDSADLAKEQTIAATSPTRPLLGLELQATERTEPVIKSYERIKQAADIAYIQRNWDEWQNNHAVGYDEVALARKNGLKVYVALDLLSYDPPRANLITAEKKIAKFSDAKIQEKYLNLVEETAARTKPDYFILLVEANMYKDRTPSEYAAFKNLLPQAIERVRKYSPNTKIGVSVTYMDHDNKNGIDAGDIAYFRECVNDFDAYSDILSVSTYPMSYQEPTKIPEDFLAQIASASKRPLFIAETSWVSESFEIDVGLFQKYKFQSSPQKQLDYFQKLKTCADFASKQNKTIEAINFVSLNDPRPIASAVFKLVNQQFGWFTSLAVSDNDGKPKPSYAFLTQWKLLDSNSHSVKPSK